MWTSGDGRKLDWNNPADMPIPVQIIQTAKANGVTGIGAGDDYMGGWPLMSALGNPASGVRAARCECACLAYGGL